MTAQGLPCESGHGNVIFERGLGGKRSRGVGLSRLASAIEIYFCAIFSGNLGNVVAARILALVQAFVIANAQAVVLRTCTNAGAICVRTAFANCDALAS